MKISKFSIILMTLAIFAVTSVLPATALGAGAVRTLTSASHRQVVGATDSVILMDATTIPGIGTCVVASLPYANTARGQVLRFEKIDSTSNSASVVVGLFSGDHIDGFHEWTTRSQFAEITLVSDGSNNWYVRSMTGTWTPT